MNNKYTEPPKLIPHWRGLGGWNYYFLLKLGLLWFGYLNFHPFANLVFAAVLLAPLPNIKLHTLRQWLAIPIGFALFYHDTWLPGVNSMLSQGDQLAGFSASYLWELIVRFINWQMLGAAFILWVAYLFIAQWLRLTIWVVVALAWLNVPSVNYDNFNFVREATVPDLAVSNSSASVVDDNNQDGPASLAPTNKNLNATLERFYQQEQQRQTEFPTSLDADAIPFDLLVINICSLSWSDLEAINLDTHPVWQNLDIVFKEFNSATSYSGPAGIRLLRASCGQSSQKALYEPTGEQCYLFDNLENLGFNSRLVMDHDGVFGGYLAELREYGSLSAPLMSQQSLPQSLVSFNNEPIFNSQAIFNRWLNERKAADEGRNATLVNLIALHDGNRIPGGQKTASYEDRAKTLFDQLNDFFEELAQSGRRVMVVVIPEHGAALVGDKVQLSGLRDIPSPSMTLVPAGVKFFGTKAPDPAHLQEVAGPTSYLAISELIARVVDGKLFTSDNIDWSALVADLPQTAVISENENAVVMEFQGKSYIRLGSSDWVLYPN